MTWKDDVKANLETGDVITEDTLYTLIDNVPDAGTTNYNDLTNKPKVNGVELTGDKTNVTLKIAQPAYWILNVDNANLDVLNIGETNPILSIQWTVEAIMANLTKVSTPYDNRTLPQKGDLIFSKDKTRLYENQVTIVDSGSPMPITIVFKLVLDDQLTEEKASLLFAKNFYDMTWGSAFGLDDVIDTSPNLNFDIAINASWNIQRYTDFETDLGSSNLECHIEFTYASGEIRVLQYAVRRTQSGVPPVPGSYNFFSFCIFDGITLYSYQLNGDGSIRGVFSPALGDYDPYNDVVTGYNVIRNDFATKLPNMLKNVVIKTITSKTHVTLEYLYDRVIPTPPASGTYTLQSVDGVLGWVNV